MKFLSISAPTGQRSTTFSESGLSIGIPGKTSTTERSPRLITQSSPVPVTSSVKRTQRVQTMQRFPQMRMLGPRSLVCLICLSSSKRDTPCRYL